MLGFLVFMDNTAAIQQAMQRRGMGQVGATQQMAPGSIAPQAMPQPSEMSMASAALPQGMGQPQGAPMPEAPQQDSDMQIALKALAGVVKNESNLKKSVIDMKAMGGV